MSIDKNPFESGERKLIPAVLLYAFSGEQVLMIHRVIKDQDFHLNKWNGLGGKLELDETPREAATREFVEEAHVFVDPSRWQARGVLFFPLFKPHKQEDWLVWIFAANLSEIEKQKIGGPGSEGVLHWINVDQVLNLNLWEGDRQFLPRIFSGQSVHGTFFYKDGKLDRYELV